MTKVLIMSKGTAARRSVTIRVMPHTLLDKYLHLMYRAAVNKFASWWLIPPASNDEVPSKPSAQMVAT